MTDTTIDWKALAAKARKRALAGELNAALALSETEVRQPNEDYTTWAYRRSRFYSVQHKASKLRRLAAYCDRRDQMALAESIGVLEDGLHSVRSDLHAVAS